MEYASCNMISGMTMHINGRIDTGENVIRLCCESLPDVPGVPLTDSPEESLRNFIGMRTMILAESIHNARLGQKNHRFSAGCTHCTYYRPGDYKINPFISYVNLSTYPSPCQCHCIYCKPQHWENTPGVQKAYENLFSMLELGKESGVFLPNATWQVSCGEITIHPYRERILEVVRGQRVVFYTNCFLYDEGIGRNLTENPGSAINLSIDAGLPQTWRRVKGTDNFETVLDNLQKYRQMSIAGGKQLTLKYIVLPDINDTYEDFSSLMEIMKAMEIPYLTLSRDVRCKYDQNSEYRTKLLGASAYLLAFCHKNGIGASLSNYSPEEGQEAVKLAGEVLQKNLV